MANQIKVLAATSVKSLQTHRTMSLWTWRASNTKSRATGVRSDSSLFVACVPTSRALMADSGKRGTDEELQEPSKRNRRLFSQAATEEDVGITAFLGTQTAFSATFKQRYSDFLVWEVRLDGSVVHLDRPLPVPTQAEEKPAGNNVEADTTSAVASPALPAVDPLVLVDEVAALLNTDDAEKLRTFLKTSAIGTSLTFNVSDDKQKRKEFHEAVRTHHKDVLDTATPQGGKGVLVRRVAGRTASHHGKGGDRGGGYPSGQPPYCSFVLYKENKDTLSAVNLLAKFLKVSTKVFGYAGTKDRRGITTQQMTAFHVSGDRLLGLNARLRGLRIGNISYTSEALHLGDLSGNRFGIVLRNLSENGTDEQIEQSIRSLQDKGFINYFGMQRFGTTSIPTFAIGVALLRNDLEEAVELLLMPRPCEQEEAVAAREEWAKNRNPKRCLDLLPVFMETERKVLKALSYKPKDFAGAFGSLPRNLRLLYLHSYQSFVWNRAVSFRVQNFGLQVIVGDLVVPRGDERAKLLQVPEIDDENPDASAAATVTTEDEPAALFRQVVQPILVTEDDVAQHRYSIEDVVLPLPGLKVVYPENAVRDQYLRILAEDGFNLSSFENRVKEYSLSGTYRYLIVRPVNLQYRSMRYDDFKLPLIKTDIDPNPETLYEDVPDGRLKALVVEFTLPTSAYATMALREILRVSTTPAFQSSTNVE